MPPADQDLNRGDQPDTEQLQESGGLPADEPEELVLQPTGPGPEVPDTLGRGTQSADGHTVPGGQYRATTQAGRSG